MDSDTEFVKRLKQGAIGGRRVNSRGNKESFQDDAFLTAVMETSLLLGNGRWHRISVVKRICRKYHVGYSRVLDKIGAGISDCGRWVGVDRESLPDAPPPRK